MRKLKARRHQIENNLYRRYEAEEADGQGCPLRAQGLHTPETRRKQLAIFIGKATETLSQKMLAKIDTPEAREIYGQRLAIGEPVCGNLRSQKRLDRFRLRGKSKVTIQWMLYGIGPNREQILHYGMRGESGNRGAVQVASHGEKERVSLITQALKETGGLRHEGVIQCDAKMEQPAKNNLRVKAFFDSLNRPLHLTACRPPLVPRFGFRARLTLALGIRAI